MFSGIKAGMQLLVTYLRGFVKIVPQKPEALGDFLAVATIWIGEVADEVGTVKTNWLGLPSADPKLSREALRQLRAKYGF